MSPILVVANINENKKNCFDEAVQKNSAFFCSVELMVIIVENATQLKPY